MSDLETALNQARAEAAALAEQLRQARLDLHRCGAADMNRTLIASALTRIPFFRSSALSSSSPAAEGILPLPTILSATSA